MVYFIIIWHWRWVFRYCWLVFGWLTLFFCCLLCERFVLLFPGGKPSLTSRNSPLILICPCLSLFLYLSISPWISNVLSLYLSASVSLGVQWSVVGHRSFLMAVALWVTQIVLVQHPKNARKLHSFSPLLTPVSPLTLFQMVLVAGMWT